MTELEKKGAVQGKIDFLEGFLSFVKGKGIYLRETAGVDNYPSLSEAHMEKLIYSYANIDPDKLKQEIQKLDDN